jgi:hypothetical protein
MGDGRKSKRHDGDDRADVNLDRHPILSCRIDRLARGLER